MYSELRWPKDTVGRLRFRYEGEGKNNKYENKLLQRLIHFTLKATKYGEYFSNDSMKGIFAPEKLTAPLLPFIKYDDSFCYLLLQKFE